MRTTVCLSLLCKHPADIREELAVGEACNAVNIYAFCFLAYGLTVGQRQKMTE